MVCTLENNHILQGGVPGTRLMYYCVHTGSYTIRQFVGCEPLGVEAQGPVNIDALLLYAYQKLHYTGFAGN